MQNFTGDTIFVVGLWVRYFIVLLCRLVGGDAMGSMQSLSLRGASSSLETHKAKAIVETNQVKAMVGAEGKKQRRSIGLASVVCNVYSSGTAADLLAAAAAAAATEQRLHSVGHS